MRIHLTGTVCAEEGYWVTLGVLVESQAQTAGQHHEVSCNMGGCCYLHALGNMWTRKDLESLMHKARGDRPEREVSGWSDGLRLPS